MFILLVFISEASPKVDFYDMVPGIWAQAFDKNHTTKYNITKGDEIITNNGNISIYSGEINGTQLKIAVNSNHSAELTYGDFPSFKVQFIVQKEGCLTFDGVLPNDVYVMATIFNPRSIEFTLKFPNDPELHTYGFFKMINNDMDMKTLAIVLGISILLTYLFRKYGGQLMG